MGIRYSHDSILRPAKFFFSFLLSVHRPNNHSKNISIFFYFSFFNSDLFVGRKNVVGYLIPQIAHMVVRILNHKFFSKEVKKT